MRLNSALIFALFCVFGLSSAQGPGLEDNKANNEDEPISVQTQIYIVTGILGGMILLLIILVLALALSLVRLRKNIYSRQNRYATASNNSLDGAGGNNQNVAQISAHGEREHIHAYDNNAFGGGGGGNNHEMQERRVDAAKDLERMGYSVYNGRNHENRITGGHQRDSRQTLMRYEDGVVPIVEATNNNHHSSPYRNNNRY